MHLWIIRHAKSSWADAGQADFKRPLNARGKQDAPRMAAWLAAQHQTPNWVWVSTAARAQATASYFLEALAIEPAQVAASPELYHSDVETIVGVAQATPSPVTNIAIVAHNPGLTYFVNWLAGETITDNLPTCGVAGFKLPAAWQQESDSPWMSLSLGAGCGELTHYMTPKMLGKADVD